MKGGSIWRRRLGTWAWPLGFLALNLTLFFGDRLVLGVRLLALESMLDSREKRLAEVQAEDARTRDLLDRAQGTRNDLEALYRDRLGPKRARLTSVLAHVKDLAARAGLDPERFTYPQQTLEDQQLQKLSFVFSVRGDFTSLRQFVTLLETSDEFLTLEQIGVSDSDDSSGASLDVRLTLSTMFAADAESAETAS